MTNTVIREAMRIAAKDVRIPKSIKILQRKVTASRRKKALDNIFEFGL